jgi:prophage DNA circulation protein
MSNAVTRTIGSINNAIGAVGRTIDAVGNLADALTGGGSSGDGQSWLDQLQPASWRGIPFQVESDQSAAGRRVALHLYPFRDDVWAEDIGRAQRVFGFSAFVVGDDCYQQAMDLRDASEQPGSGILVHPWLGTLEVTQTTPPKFSVRRDLGRVVEIEFQFVETGSPIYPSADTDTEDAVDGWADDADDAASESFADQIGDIVNQGATIAQTAVNTVQGVVNTVGSVIGDASLVAHAVAGIAAPAGYDYGRYADGARGTILAGINTVQGAIGAVSQARAAVQNTISNVTHLASSL